MAAVGGCSPVVAGAVWPWVAWLMAAVGGCWAGDCLPLADPLWAGLRFVCVRLRQTLQFPWPLHSSPRSARALTAPPSSVPHPTLPGLDQSLHPYWRELWPDY